MRLFFQDELQSQFAAHPELGVRWEYQPPFQEMHSGSRLESQQDGPRHGREGRLRFRGEIARFARGANTSETLVTATSAVSLCVSSIQQLDGGADRMDLLEATRLTASPEPRW